MQSPAITCLCSVLLARVSGHDEPELSRGPPTHQDIADEPDKAFESFAAEYKIALKDAGASYHVLETMDYKLEKIRIKAKGVAKTQYQDSWTSGISSMQENLDHFKNGESESILTGLGNILVGFAGVVPDPFGTAVSAVGSLVLGFFGVSEKKPSMLELMDDMISKKLETLKNELEDSMDIRDITEMMGEIEGVKRNMNQMRNLLMSGMETAAKGTKLTVQDVEFISCQVSVIEGAEVMGKLKVFIISQSKKCDTVEKGRRVLILLDAYAKMVVLRKALLEDARLFYDIANMTTLPSRSIEKALNADREYNEWVRFMINAHRSQLSVVMSLKKYPNEFLEKFLVSYQAHPFMYHGLVEGKCLTLSAAWNTRGCMLGHSVCFLSEVDHLRCHEEGCKKAFECRGEKKDTESPIPPSYIECNVGYDNAPENPRYPLIAKDYLTSKGLSEETAKFGLFKIENFYQFLYLNEKEKNYSKLWLTGFSMRAEKPSEEGEEMPGFNIDFEDC